MFSVLKRKDDNYVYKNRCNADCLSVIKCSYTAIEAVTKDRSRTTLASYDSEKVCTLAFEMLAEKNGRKQRALRSERVSQDGGRGDPYTGVNGLQPRTAQICY